MVWQADRKCHRPDIRNASLALAKTCPMIYLVNAESTPTQHNAGMKCVDIAWGTLLRRYGLNLPLTTMLGYRGTVNGFRNVRRHRLLDFLFCSCCQSAEIAASASPVPGTAYAYHGAGMVDRALCVMVSPG